MNMPKPRPKTQNTSPTISNLWPSTPRNETEERSGSFRAASPPSSVGCASAWPAVTSSKLARVAEVFANHGPTDARLAIQVRIKILQYIQGLGRLTLLRRATAATEVPNALPPQGIPIKKKSADLAASNNLRAGVYSKVRL